MKLAYCNCSPDVEVARFRAWIQNSTGGGIFSPGATIEEAISNVIKHARKDRFLKRDWRARIVTSLEDGQVVGTFSSDGTFCPD